MVLIVLIILYISKHLLYIYATFLNILELTYDLKNY